MAENGVDALLVSNMVNIQWLTGFTGSFASDIVTTYKAVFITDSRYTIQSDAEDSDYEILSFASPRTGDQGLQEELQKLNIKKLAFETSVTYSAWSGRKTNFPDLEWTPAPDTHITNLRMIKSEYEIAKIKRACNLADSCMEHV